MGTDSSLLVKTIRLAVPHSVTVKSRLGTLKTPRILRSRILDCFFFISEIARMTFQIGVDPS